MFKLLLIALVFCAGLYANEMEFIREYTYHASDDDSKNSSRKKALTQIKSLVSEEVGSFIKSSIVLQTKQNNDKLDQLIDSKIQSISQNFIHISILDEKWNGVEYYVKAKVKVDKKRTEDILKELTNNNRYKEKQPTTSKKTYVEMQDSQPLYMYGKYIGDASYGEIFEVLAEVDCIRGGGKCWIMRNIKTNQRGVAKADILKSTHRVYEK